MIMADEFIIKVLIIAVGCFAFYQAHRFLKDDKFADEYTRTSPKAFIWRKIFGVEKAKKITKAIFAPAGLVLSILMILVGIVLLLI
jgi:hypothetical protein